MAVLTIQDLPKDGSIASLTFAAMTTADELPNDGRTILIVKNDDAGAHTVTAAPTIDLGTLITETGTAPLTQLKHHQADSAATVRPLWERAVGTLATHPAEALPDRFSRYPSTSPETWHRHSQGTQHRCSMRYRKSCTTSRPQLPL